VHATQLPFPSHTPLETLVDTHALPAATAVPWSEHVDAPPVHDVTFPTSQGFDGAHDAPTVHALQTPP
jgi:hypothetical protein